MNIIDKSVQVVTTTDGAGIVKPLCFFTTEYESKQIMPVKRINNRKI